MPKPSSSLIQCIYNMAGVHRDDTRSDAELLSRYAETHDEQAFSALMVRHGPMVWGVCRRVLRNAEDAEEAYQTIFLALARKAGKVNVSLAGWLHLVANQTALNARRDAKARRRLQEGAKAIGHFSISAESQQVEVCEELHHELAKLPETLRVALVLHYLEGRTQAEVAALLGVKESAIWNRLARGKAMLEKRLTQRGLALTAATVGSLLEAAASHAAIPHELVSKTVKAATAFRNGKLRGGLAKLAHEVLRRAPSGTPWWKTGWLITMLCISGLGMGTGAVVWKIVFFGTKADGLTVPSRNYSPPQTEKDGPKPPRLDRHGDPLPRGAVGRLGTTRLNCRGASLVFSPDSAELITASLDETKGSCLWDVATGRLVRCLPLEASTLAISRDGRVALAACRDAKGLRLWDTKSWQSSGRIKIADDQSSLSSTVAISSDGAKMLFSGDNGACLWDVTAGKKIWEKKEGFSGRHIVFSPDGKTLVWTDVTTFHVCDAATGNEIRHWKKDRYSILSWSYSPTDHLLASAHVPVRQQGLFPWDEGEGITCLWDPSTGREIRQWVDSKADIREVAFSPKGNTLATANSKGWISLWDVAKGRELRCYRGGVEWPNTLVFSPNGKMLATASLFLNRTVRICDVETGREITPLNDRHRSGVKLVAFTQDNKEIISGGIDGVLCIWDATTFIPQTRYNLASKEVSLAPRSFSSAVSPDGLTIASVENRFGKNDKNDRILTGSFRLEKRADGLKRELIGCQDVGECLGGGKTTFSLDGKKLACTQFKAGANACVWDVGTGRKISDRISTDGRIMAFSPNGKILSLSDDKSIVFWDIERNVAIRSIPIPDDGVACMAFSPDGRTLAVADGKGGIELWRVHLCPKAIEIGSCSRLFHHSMQREGDILGTTLAFSPDSRTLAVATGRRGNRSCIHLMETASGKERQFFEGHEDEIHSLAFALDGRRMASGSEDTTILIWDVTGRLEQGKLRFPLLSPQAAESLWVALGNSDAKRAGEAIWAFALAPKQTIPFFRKRLLSTGSEGLFGLNEALEQRIGRLIADLDNDKFRYRRKAESELRKIGYVAAPALRQALHTRPSLHAQKRMKQILDDLREDAERPSSAELLCKRRAIEVLGHIDDLDAQHLLEALSQAIPGRHQNVIEDAQAALRRLGGK